MYARETYLAREFPRAAEREGESGFFFSFENRRRREEDPSVVAPPSSVTEKKLGVCVGRGCVLEVIVIGLLLDFIDRGCLSSIIKTRP